jgi:hypothetical protein
MSFWNNVYDDTKDRRYGTLFFITFFCIIGLVLLGLFLGIQFCASVPPEVVYAGVAVAVLVLALIGWRWACIERKYQRDKLKYSALSRDELAKARSKLKKQIRPATFKTRMKSSVRHSPRRMDTYLKY